MNNPISRSQALNALLAQSDDIKRFVIEVLTDSCDGAPSPGAGATVNRPQPSRPATKATARTKTAPAASKPRRAAKKAVPARRPKAKRAAPAPKTAGEAPKKRGRQRQYHDITEFGDLSGRYEGMKVGKASRAFFEEFGHDHDPAKVRDALEAGGVEPKPNNLTLVRGAHRTWVKNNG